MNTQIYEEASEWIILHRTDTLDTDAKRRFDTWLRESPQHLKAYLEMSTIWEDVPALNRDWNPSADQLIARAREDSNVVTLTEIKTPGQALQSLPITVPASSVWTKLLAIAAVLLVTVGGAGWFYLQRGLYATDIGEQRTLALTDGSTVELNAHTKIRVAYTDQTRTIELLQGQALFKVTKDASRPFVVDANGTQVRAIGTQFDVYKKTDGTLVTVVEGRVAVAPATATVSGTGGSGVSGTVPPSDAMHEAVSGTDSAPRASNEHASHALQPRSGEVLLSAGEQLMVAAVVSDAATAEIQVPTVPQPANLEAATAWTQQRFVFDFTPLTEVAEEFNRYNRRRLIIDDPTLETFNISGSFSSTDPTLLLRFLREQPEVVLTESASEIHISRHDAGAGAIGLEEGNPPSQ